MSGVAGWLFLAASLWGAWFTWNAWRPTFAGRHMAVWSFFAGWLTNELALHHVVWQAAATLLFAWAGALQHLPGQLGLAITLASWVGLVGVQRRAAQARGAVEQALRHDLGAEAGLALPPEPEVPAAIDWMRVLRPFPIRRREVEKLRNIPFARERGVELRLDLYRRRPEPGTEASAPRPVLLQIHGGAWIMGDKREQALPLMYQMAAQGWICVSANYRLSPHATFPEHLVDCKRALAWVRQHVADYGGDPDFVVVTGGSAGGHLAALVALTANDPEYQPGFEDVDTSVRACVPFYGVYDFVDRHGGYRHDGLLRTLERQVLKGSLEEIPEEWERASPIARVHADAPPFLVVHGDCDTLVPVVQAREFVRALREKSRSPVVYAEIPGAQHAFELFPSLRALAVNVGVERFLAAVHDRYRRGQTPAETPREGAGREKLR
jgi:acetyl esterase/lipase